MRHIALAVMVGVVVACSGPTTTSPESVPPPQICTEIGCNSGFTVELSDVDLVEGATYEVELCVGGECVSTSVASGEMAEVSPGRPFDPESLQSGSVLVDVERNAVEFMLALVQFEASEDVSFSVTDADSGDQLAAVDSVEVDFERLQPNGPGCPPVCFVARLIV